MEDFLVPPPPGEDDVDSPASYVDSHDSPSPAIQFSGDVALDHITAGLPQNQREKVVEAWARLEGAETTFPGTLAICLNSLAIYVAKEIKASVATLRDLPLELANTCSSLNVSINDHGLAVAETRASAAESLILVKNIEAGLIDVRRNGRIALGLASTVMLVGCVLASIGVSSLKEATKVRSQVLFQQASMEGRNTLSLRVIDLAWQKLLIQGGKSNTKEEWDALRKKAALTADDEQYLANLQKVWTKLCDEEALLKEKETALAGELNKEVGPERK